ncbi:MAG: PD-(D/E)XK nuclease family protein [Acidobacteria bacterium]|nr:PD-(D/E)XK nuclease family protein [Acidobacteriota bacterium]
MNLLTSSRLKDARACGRLHHLKYARGIRARHAAEALRDGSLLHALLEAWWLQRRPEERLSAGLAVLGAATQAGFEPFAAARLEAMLTGYDARWRGEPVEVLAIEAEFRAPLVNPQSGRASKAWQLAGKVDGLVRLPDGRVMLLEHKSSSEDVSPGSDYWRRLRLDSQVSIYYDGARALGHEVAGCIYDVLKKPAVRPQRATPPEARKFTRAGELYKGQRIDDETPAEYGARCLETIAADPSGHYQRGEVVRFADELDAARYDVWQTAAQIREADRAGRHPRNPDACVRYGRTCEFWRACTGEASLDDPTLFQRLDFVHPELTAPGA